MRRLTMPEEDGPGLRWVTGSKEIRSIRRAGILQRGSLVFVWTSESVPNEADHAAVALVTRRGFKGAVARNLAKRRLRGSVLDKRDLLEPGKRYLIEGRPGLEKVYYQILVNEISDLLLRSVTCVKKGREPGGE